MWKIFLVFIWVSTFYMFNVTCSYVLVPNLALFDMECQNTLQINSGLNVRKPNIARNSINYSVTTCCKTLTLVRQSANVFLYFIFIKKEVAYEQHKNTIQNLFRRK